MSLRFFVYVLRIILLTLLVSSLPTVSTTPALASDSTSDDNRQKLADLARRIHLTRPQDSKSAPGEPIHITNENLVQVGGGGNLTEVTGTPPTGQPPEGAAPTQQSGPDVNGSRNSALGSEEAKREYWRGRYLAAKAGLIAAENELTVLDDEIPNLWSLFYACDDPVRRDQVIAPRVNAAIGQRGALATTIEAQRTNLSKILVEARDDGALPGWFRDIR